MISSLNRLRLSRQQSFNTLKIGDLLDDDNSIHLVELSHELVYDAPKYVPRQRNWKLRQKEEVENLYNQASRETTEETLNLIKERFGHIQKLFVHPLNFAAGAKKRDVKICSLLPNLRTLVGFRWSFRFLFESRLGFLLHIDGTSFAFADRI
ncbi:hypothetical protein BC829DRAFT_126397 [Chytridium lagenaria]|nr:hypothetical protein BC829DRAFT_126397 [Chytridium lagenaria]